MSEDIDGRTSDEGEVVERRFVGPAQTSWWKYRVAQYAIRFLTNRPRIANTRVGYWLFDWGTDVLFGSRETVVVESSSEDR